MAEANNPGEQKAWDIIASLRPDEVCRAAGATYDPAAAAYRLSSFGREFVVSTRERTITTAAEGSEALLRQLGYFFRLSVLWYLAGAKDISCTGRPVKLDHVKGGDLFTRGSHALPLAAIAEKYGGDREGFLKKGRSLGGEEVRGGDAALLLAPLPRIPVTLTLWLADDEFPATADLQFDTSCELHLAVDVLWSVAMMSCLIML